LSRGKVPKEYYSDRRREIKKELVDYKGGSCVICGYDKSYRSLHFHHLNPDEKDFTLGRKWGKLGFNDTIKKELDKCILVCANCHGEIHDGLIQI
jgi:5-methylcytosine-specific restriction endonuclease McrA